MNPAAASAIVSSAVALTVAAYALRLGRTPGWSVYRWLAVIAIGSSLYALGNLATTTGQPDGIVLIASRFQLFGLMVELWGWFHFADDDTGTAPPTWERWLRRGLLLLGVASLAPHVAYGGAVTGHTFEPWGASYRDAVPTGLGIFTFAVGVAASVYLVARFVSAARRGARDAALHGGALGVLVLFAVNDALAGVGLLDTPYLLDIGFLVPLGALFWSQGGRFIEEAARLRELSGRLEVLVEARTTELDEANRALHQAERLAALGQFAAGVAHRVNNPAAVVQSALDQMHDALSRGRLGGEANEVLLEARESMRRIGGLVRQLADAGRVVSAAPHAADCELRPILERAAEEVRGRHPAGVSIYVDVKAGLRVRMGADELHRVAASLLANAAQAAHRGQALIVVASARQADGVVTLSIADDGVGMTGEVASRAFDPFFTTRPEGMGAGLGLTVARALVESCGGSITLESAVGAGAVARVRLPALPAGGRSAVTAAPLS